MFDPTRRLIDEVAAAIDQHAPARYLRADDLLLWARQRYDRGLLLLDEDGRSVPLSPMQITKAAAVAATLRSA